MPLVQIFHRQRYSTAPDGIASSIRERDIRRANLRRFPYHFLFRGVGHEVRILVVRHHHRFPSLDPDVDRSMAEYERVSPGVDLNFIGTSGGGGRDSESVQTS